MDIRSLKIIESVARHKSFSKAAEEVCLSTAAVSAAVIKAEDVIGLPLFERTTRQVSATPLAERLLPRIRLLLKDYGELMSDIQDTVRHRTGHVAIGCLSSIAVRILPKAVARCRTIYPRVDIEIRDAATAAVYEDVAARRTEFAVVGEYEAQLGLAFTPLMDDPLVLVCPASHELATMPEVNLTDLEKFEFVLLSRETGVRKAIEEAIGPLNVRFVIKHEVTQISSLIGLVQEGLGISIVPSLSLPQAHVSGLAVVRQLSPHLSRKIGLLRRIDRPLTPAAQAAMECVQHCLEEHRRSIE